VSGPYVRAADAEEAVNPRLLSGASGRSPSTSPLGAARCRGAVTSEVSQCAGYISFSLL
jgi:hypothetical protein